MSKCEDFYTSFWDDEEMLALSPDAKLLYIWSFTNSAVGPAGVYQLARRNMQATGLDDERLNAAWKELLEAGVLVYEKPYLWVRGRVKRLRSKQRMMAKGVANQIARIEPDHPIRSRFMDRYGSTSWLLDAFRAVLSEPLGRSQDSPPVSQIRRTSQRFQGTGTGQGTGNVKKNSNDKEDWVRREMPDMVERDLIPMAVVAIAYEGFDVDRVRARVLARYGREAA